MRDGGATGGSAHSDLRLYLDFLFELVEGTADFAVASGVLRDFFTGVEDGGVVFSPEGFADVAEG